MKKVICFFACEAGAGGKELGWELYVRIQKLREVLHDPEFDGAQVLIVRGAAGFDPPALYSNLVASSLIISPQLGKAIVIPCDALRTAGEIDAFEAWLKLQYPSCKVWAASSDYHVWRISRIWEMRHGRTVGVLSLRVPRTWYIRKRMLLEYPKRLLSYAPAWVQDLLGKIMRKLHMI